MGSQLAKKYEIQKDPISFGGIGQPWRIHRAKTKDRSKSEVSVFMFDKKALSQNREKQAIVNTLKAEATNLAKLRHPNILQVVEPLLEDNKTLAFATEPLQHCLGDLLRNSRLLSEVLCDTEVRLGLLDLIQALSFLHSEARIVHFSLCPENVYITTAGKWKISGLMFAQNLNQDSKAYLGELDIVLAAKSLRYQASLGTQAPLLHFSAPEVVGSNAGDCSSDIFSLGCTIYTIYKALSGQPGELLNIEEYSKQGHRNACMALKHAPSLAVSCLPPQLSELVLRMADFESSQRASLHELSVCKAFQTPYVKAIYYLEHLNEKQESQRLAFFKGLSTIIEKFDRIIMLKRLLPAIVQNMKDLSLTPHILPTLFTVIKQCELKQDQFQELVWPSISKLTLAKEIPAQSFYLVLSEIDLLMQYCEEEKSKKYLMPMVFRGYECGVAQIEEVLMKKTPEMLSKIQDKTYLKTQVLPRLLQGIIKTKSSSVREQGLKSLGAVHTSFDRSTMIDTILPCLDKLKKLDMTGPMLMPLLDVYEGVSRSLGYKVTATNIIPALSPLLVNGEMTKDEFSRLCECLESMFAMVRNYRSQELPTQNEAPEKFEFEESNQEPELKDIFGEIPKPEIADIFGELVDQPEVKLPPPKKHPVNQVYLQPDPFTALEKPSTLNPFDQPEFQVDYCFKGVQSKPQSQDLLSDFTSDPFAGL